MGVVISKPAINIREQLTELKATQGYEERQFHFDNLVTNGTFDTDTDWTKGTGWTINTTTNVAECDGTQTANTDLSQALSGIQAGRVYRVSTQLTLSAGIFRFAFFDGANSVSPDFNSSGDAVYYYTAARDTVSVAGRGTAAFVGSIDNFSIYEVDPSDNKVIHTMPKGWKPLHVFEDGALQREGSAYDYTVEYDGFNYIVKETVAPVAPYSTTVIGVRA